MSARKAETPEEYRANQRRMRERYACDCDKQLDKDVKVLRKAVAVLEVWGLHGYVEDIEGAIKTAVDYKLKAQGL